MDIETLSKQFVQFEEKEQLFSRKLRDIHFWRLIRFKLFLLLTIEADLHKEAHPDLKNKSTASNINMLLRNFLFHRPSKVKNIDVLFIPHSRAINGKDIYADRIISYHNDKNIAFLFPYRKNFEYEPSISFARALIKSILIQKLNRIKNFYFSKDELNYIKNTNQLFQKNFNSQINIESLIHNEIIKFSSLEKSFLNFLERAKPKKIILSTHYSYFPYISAAQKLDIPVFEIQHGTITTNHMGYYFPYDKTLPYTPDTLLCHGEYWAQKPPLPKGLKTQIIGAEHINKNVNSEKIKDQIMFFSQATIAEELFEFAYETAQKLPNKKILYRLHPSELIEDYEKKISSKKSLANFEIKNDNQSFFKDITASEYVAGVYSTTLFEALAFGAKVIIVALDGHKAVKNLVNSGHANLVHTPIDLSKKIDSFTTNTANYYYASKLADLENIFQTKKDA